MATPIVLIPGILGSRLVDRNGRNFWGSRTSLRELHLLDLESTTPHSSLSPDGLVDKIRVLGPFWTVHQYDYLLTHLEALGFQSGRNLFTFAYDWRKSNFDTADRFDNFIHEHPVLQSEQFDIIAHSMGGIVAKLWMHKHGGARRVRKVFYLGTPFLGSMNALGTLTEGWGAFLNIIAGGIDVIRHTMLSFPSLYELFPSYVGGCRFGEPSRFEPFDIYDPEVWNEHGWLPRDYADGGSRAEMFRSSLKRAAYIPALMAERTPDVSEFKITGRHQGTRLYLYVDRRQSNWRGWTFSMSLGDGTVSVWSASNSTDGNLAGSLPSFVEHATIFRDEWVREKIQYELVTSAPPRVNAQRLEIVTSSGTSQPLTFLDARLEPALVSPGVSTKLTVCLQFPADAPIKRGDVKGLTAELGDISGTSIPLVEITDAADISQRILRFAAELRAPNKEEVYRVDIDVPPLGRRAVYLTVERHNP